MKNSMFKSTIREIKGSFGRWFAILAIIALGVGFFTGLKVCKPAFLETGNTYLQEHSFFDYQLISTLGLEEEDISAFSDIDSVEVAEGSYSADVLITEDDSEMGDLVTKFLTISKNINTPALVAGKMPENDNECLGDSQNFTENDIGKHVTISSSNKESTVDMLTYETYTITGIADSPLYLNFERGSSPIGDGSVACFIMINPGGFSSDVFTEAYIKLSQSAYIFSDEYNEIRKASKEPLEQAVEDASDRRYASIIDEARQKVADIESDILENEKKLIDAEATLATNEKDLQDKQLALNSGFEQYNILVSEYQQGRKVAYDQLDAAYASGSLTEAQYNEQLSQLNQQFDAGWAQLQSLKAELDSNQAKLSSGFEEVEKAKADLSAGMAELEDGKQKLKDAKKEINKIEYPDSYALDRQTNIGYVCFSNDTSIVEGIAKVFPVFFFLVAALVCITTMSRMIEEQRTQIGVLKALGYGTNQILSKYMFYSGTSALIGGITGFFVGTYLFPWVIWQAYRMMYDFADITFVFDWYTGGLVILAALVCSVGTTLYSCYHELAQVPAQLIRPKAPAAGKRIFLERVPAIWKRLKFLQKVSIRNVFRYKKRFFMMVVGVCGCTALLITGFGVRDSIKNVVDTQYEEIFHIDYEVTFNHGIDNDEQAAFLEENDSYINKCLFLYTGAVDARINDQVKSINLVVCNNDENIRDFVDLHNGSEPLAYPSKGEGIINDNLAKSLNLTVGDSITVHDSNMKPLTVKIVGLCDNYVYNYLYINDQTYESQLGDVEVNAAYILNGNQESKESALEPHEVGSNIMDSENVTSVTVTEDFRNRIANTLKSLDYVIALIIACAAALAFIVLYNLTNINITERIREIATIKVLGFYSRETSSYVFRENVILTAISALVGLPLGTWLHRFVMDRIQVDLLSFDVHITLFSYMLGVLGTFIFAMIVNLFMRRKIAKVNMTESLKSIE